MRTLLLSLLFFLLSSPAFAGTCDQDSQIVQLEDALNQMGNGEKLGDVVKIAFDRICSHDAVGKAQSLRSVTALKVYLRGVSSPYMDHALEQIIVALTQ